ncbi:hypothetical protein [Oceanivirga miroungae]|uniref:Cell division protein FtsL n=1 Tax=Oceanivirga miroungae TaxID=1130046 RepID=A0A6I8ME10_9FUSO|nr:hypothetical protein [Oceanivirga miroungae]VWL85434.1 hypothetical protein OMES3154_00719 [Oceanivirga miroungae]
MVTVNRKIITEAKKLSIIDVKALANYATIFVFAVLATIAIVVNVKYNNELGYIANTNYVLETRLNKLVEENSVLEGIKANSLNMREIQKKALELGFVYNNDINYVK